MNELEKECLEYFRQARIWERLFSGFQRKYESYGSFSGSVRLTGLTDTDIETLEGFFGRNYHTQKSVTIRAEQFRQALEGSRFRDLTPECILTLYFGTELIGKKERTEQKKRERKEVLSGLKAAYAETPAADRIEEFAQLIKYDAKMSAADWKRKLYLCAETYNGLPYRANRYTYLAVFAAQVTGNPHAFDAGTDGGRILEQVVEQDLCMRGIRIPVKKDFHAYKRQKSYLEAGILIDDISNFAMLYGVRAWNRKDALHRGMEGFLAERDMVQVPLAVISRWERLSCPGNQMYIVENPAIYAHLCENADGTCAYMCMNGQPRLAGLLILDLLAKSETEVYYAGDMDPEGVLIAQKLARYYCGSFTYRHMTAETYRRCISEEPISERRLRILDRIIDPALYPLAQEIRAHKKAGYQENLLIQKNEHGNL